MNPAVQPSSQPVHWTEAPIHQPGRVWIDAVYLWCGEREPARPVQRPRPPCPRCGGWTFLEVGRA